MGGFNKSGPENEEFTEKGNFFILGAGKKKKKGEGKKKKGEGGGKGGDFDDSDDY